ncbi:hypothetical protein TRIUR3_07331 [Triticum urartu]|uniref:BHLH domain-containing protein n=1 Tax=Triticum urartu TaxID=4572 RepID=M7Z0A5_TRIUA|nr:hypothetical protein TRIUR3_07331 [Triticum urartu]
MTLRDGHHRVVTFFSTHIGTAPAATAGGRHWGTRKSGTTHVTAQEPILVEHRPRCGATRGSMTLCHMEMGMAMPAPMLSADVGESITVDNGSNDLSRSFSMSSSDDTNSNIMFSTPGSKMDKVLIDSDGGMITNLSKIESQERRASNSKKLRRLQDLVPNMDKQTTASDKDLEYLLISGERVVSRPKRLSSW